jgi:HAD superfamily hydrolase (TIGR01509 family)
LIERFGHQFPLTDFRRRWPTRWRDGVERTGVTIKPGLVELLDYLEARRLPVAIATSSEAEYAALTLRGAGLAGRVQAIVTGDTVENGKPAPDIYLKAAALVGATPARCVAFEDSEPGIRAVAAAGMIGILVPEATPSAVATASASWIVPSLHEGRRLLARLVTRGEGA